MADNYERRLKEWRWHLAKMSNTYLHQYRMTLMTWIDNPIHIYGTSEMAQADRAYDQRRVAAIDAELTRRGLTNG